MFFEKFLNYVYPNSCILCGKSIKSNSYTCENCTSILKYYRGRYLENSCLKNVDEILNLYEYTGIIKKKILQYKFGNQKYLYKFFAHILSEKLNELKIDFDIIISVPISMTRYKERGYNQSFLIAKELSKILKKEIYKKALRKCKNNKRQSDLNIEERQKNVLGVYQYKSKKALTNKKVLLVDDIYTTGATLNECAKVLKQSGCNKVIAVTIAYAKKEFRSERKRFV